MEEREIMMEEREIEELGENDKTKRNCEKKVEKKGMQMTQSHHFQL